MTLSIRTFANEDLATVLLPAQIALGFPPIPERVEQMKTLPELALLLSMLDGEQAVGSASAFAFQLTVPGGRPVDTWGVTMVGVLPTHRRRGILTELMRKHFEVARSRQQPLAALFASEGSIYQRFGYGIASLCAEIDMAREHTAFLPDAPKGTVRARLVDEEEALLTFPAIWDRVRKKTPGMLSRSSHWWRVRRVGDPPWMRGGRTQLQRVLLEVDGELAAYAIYRLNDAGWDGNNINRLHAEVIEAVGDGPAATAAVWRYLYDLDLAREIKARQLPIDHPLQWLLVDARRLRMRVFDGLWVRLLDVEAALSLREYGASSPLVLAVTDSFCPWNEGNYLLQDGVAKRTTAAPDLRLSVDALSSLYLGAFRFTQLAAAGRITELREGALRQADALFASSPAPWAPEIF